MPESRKMCSRVHFRESVKRAIFGDCQILWGGERPGKCTPILFWIFDEGRNTMLKSYSDLLAIVPPLGATSLGAESRALIFALVGALSLGSVHFIGFCLRLPFQIVDALDSSVIAYFLAKFAFYFLMAYFIARVVCELILGLILSIQATFFRFSRSRRWSARSFLRDRASLAFHRLWMVVLGVGTLFPAVYLGLSLSAIGRGSLLLLVGILFLVFCNSYVFPIYPFGLLKRIVAGKGLRARMRSAANGRRLLLGVARSTLLVAPILSLWAGFLRFDRLESLSPVKIEAFGYSSEARVLLSSPGAVLLSYEKDKDTCLAYISPAIRVFSPKSKKSACGEHLGSTESGLAL